jgi:hypothetical protein
MDGREYDETQQQEQHQDHTHTHTQTDLGRACVEKLEQPVEVECERRVLLAHVHDVHREGGLFGSPATNQQSISQIRHHDKKTRKGFFLKNNKQIDIPEIEERG